MPTPNSPAELSRLISERQSLSDIQAQSEILRSQQQTTAQFNRSFYDHLRQRESLDYSLNRELSQVQENLAREARERVARETRRTASQTVREAVTREVTEATRQAPINPVGALIDLGVGLLYEPLMDVATGASGSAFEALADSLGRSYREDAPRGLAAFNPFNPDSQLSWSNLVQEMLDPDADLTPEERALQQEFNSLGDRNPLALFESLHNLWDALTPDGNYDRRVTEALESIEQDRESGASLEEINQRLSELIEEIENGTDNDGGGTGNEVITSFPPFNPPSSPPQDGYYDVIIIYGVYGAFFSGVNDPNQGENFVSLGRTVTRATRRVSNPTVQVEQEKIGQWVFDNSSGVSLLNRVSGVHILNRQGERIQSHLTQEAQGLIRLNASQGRWYVPQSIEYLFVAPADWDPEEDPPFDFDFECEAPTLFPQIEERLNGNDEKIAALNSKLDAINGAIQAKIDTRFVEIIEYLAIIQGNVNNVNGPKQDAKDDGRLNSTLNGQREIRDYLETKINEITAPDLSPLQGAILTELGLTKADILNADEASRQALLTALQNGDTAVLEATLAGQEAIRQNLLESQVLGFQNVVNNDNLNTQTILTELNDIDVNVDLSQLPTIDYLDTALAAQNAAQATDNDEQTQEILTALIDTETGQINVSVDFPDDYVKVDDLTAQTTAINAATESQIQEVTDTLGTTGTEDPRTAMDMLRQLAGPAAVAGSVLAVAKSLADNNTELLARLGPQVSGGISTVVTATDSFVKKAWKATRMDKVINLITMLAALHNAAMLSRNLGETFGELASQVLGVFGIRDENDSPIDVNEILGQTIETAVKAVVGEQIYTGVSDAWNKASRILSSASQIVWTVRSIMDSATEVAEWAAENTGRIGNALKKWGVVGPRSYPWMAEKVNAQNRWRRRFDGFIEGVETLDDTAASLGTVVGEVRSIQEEVGEIGEQRQRFEDAMRDAIPETPPDNQPVKATEDAAKQASESPDIANTDMTVGP